MKNILIFILTFTFFALHGQAQKEVLIIGTMHTVPKIVKNSYKPLLKAAKAYAPEAIYVERVRPTDTLSLKNYYSNFLLRADSVAQSFEADEEKKERLLEQDLANMTPEDYQYLSTYYLVKKDYANFEFYRYLNRHGVQGSEQPTRNENGDLTAKLAIAQNHKYIYSMDDQQENPKYYTAWRTCAKEGKTNGNDKIKKKLLRQLTIQEYFAGALGKLGNAMNTSTSLARMHALNSFEYAEVTTEACQLGNQYWDNRNFRMTKNVAEQVRAQSHQRNIVIVGAGHVYGMLEAFEQHFPDLKVLTLEAL